MLFITIWSLKFHLHADINNIAIELEFPEILYRWLKTLFIFSLVAGSAGWQIDKYMYIYIMYVHRMHIVRAIGFTRGWDHFCANSRKVLKIPKLAQNLWIARQKWPELAKCACRVKIASNLRKKHFFSNSRPISRFTFAISCQNWLEVLRWLKVEPFHTNAIFKFWDAVSVAKAKMIQD